MAYYKKFDNRESAGRDSKGFSKGFNKGFGGERGYGNDRRGERDRYQERPSFGAKGGFDRQDRPAFSGNANFQSRDRTSFAGGRFEQKARTDFRNDRTAPAARPQVRDGKFQPREQHGDVRRDGGFKPERRDFGRDTGFKPERRDFGRDTGFKSERRDFGRDTGFKSERRDFGRDTGFKSERRDFGRDTGFKPERRDFGRDTGYQGKDRGDFRAPRFGDQKPMGEKREGFAPRFGRPAFEQKSFAPREQRFGRPAPAAPVPAPAEAETMERDENILCGRNPIREALKAGRDIEKLLVADGDLTGSAREIVSAAKEAGIKIQKVEKSYLDQIVRNHQGLVAFASAYQYAEVEDILALAQEKQEKPFIIILDQITDPHNMGAIIRSAACTGAHGVIIPKNRAVGLSSVAVKTSSGAVEYVKVARVVNLTQTIKSLKEKNIWVYAADMAGQDVRTVDFTHGTALVIGNEGEGISPLVKSVCDQVVSLPMVGEIASLNASVAAGVMMYSVYNARHPLV